MPDDLVMRALSAWDANAICRHREAMFLEMGRDPELVAAMAASFRPWLEERLAQARYFGFMAEAEGCVIGFWCCHRRIRQRRGRR